MLIDHDAFTPGAPSSRDLVAEANHRIANSLAALSGLLQHQIRQVGSDDPMSSDDVKRMLGEVRARVEAVARLHRTLSDVPVDGAIDLGKHLRAIATELIATLTQPNTVGLHFVESDCRTAPDVAFYLGLVTVELITNAIKYAHPAGVRGEIWLRCLRTHGAIVIEISDDGVGLPDGYETESSPSGLRIVRSLVEQLDGTVHFSSDALGLTCTIEIPLHGVCFPDAANAR